MINCSHCGKRVRQEDELGYEVLVSRWTMDFPKVREYFHYHEDCWSAAFIPNYITPPNSMEDLFGDYIEPSKEKATSPEVA